MKQNKNVPEIRFEGFTDDWEQHKLGEVSNSFSGGTPTVGVKEYYGGHISFIRSAEINSSTTEFFITEKGLNSSSAKLVDIGDILYALYGATSGEVGRARLKGAINQAILAIKPHNEYDAEYLTQWLSKSKRSIIEKYLQGGQGNLSGTIVKGLLIEFPIYQEQRKIGQFFASLDYLTNLYQQKYEKFLDLKKAMLYKLFPKEGETTPEVRFDGFSGEWEKRKIKEVCNISNGCMNTQDAKEKGKYPFFIRSEEIMKSDRYVYDEEAILTPGEGRIGEIFHYINGKYTAHQRVYRLFCFSEEVYPIFLLHELKNKFKKHALQNSSTATAPSIRMGTIADYEFMLPDFEEQKAIGEYFSKLDQLIALNKEKLEKLKNIKALLLDKMFV